MQRSNWYVIPALLVAGVSASIAQLPMLRSSGGGSLVGGIFQGTQSYSLPLPPIPLMAGAPYSGEEEIESSIPGRGSVVRPSAFHRKVWRDSQGRIRIERSLAPRTRAPGVPTIVEILDPVAGYIYIMDDIHRVAHRVKATVTQQPNVEEKVKLLLGGPAAAPELAAQLGASSLANVPRPAAAQRPGASAPQPQVTLQDLGMQVIDGVVAHGMRGTRVVAAGLQGNDRPMTVARDMWYSPELNMVIRTVTAGLSGGSTERVANLSRNQPDPMLFMVPTDYRVVDESGSFEIRWGK